MVEFGGYISTDCRCRPSTSFTFRRRLENAASNESLAGAEARGMRRIEMQSTPADGWLAALGLAALRFRRR